MEARYYQNEARLACYEFLRTRPNDNPIIVLPTGTGKTIVIRDILTDIVTKRRARGVLLAHRKELLAQAEEKFRGRVGVYSASLKRRETFCDITLAQIQSVYRRAHEIGAVDAVLVDEAHLVTISEDGMFRQFLSDMKVINPKCRLIGLTATPYRMVEGLVCSPDGPFHDICYEYTIHQAIADGFLCPLVSKRAESSIDHDGLHKVRGEYVSSEVDKRMQGVIPAACNEIFRLTQDRHSVLVFASCVKHAEAIVDALGAFDSYVITGQTEQRLRDGLLRGFKQQKFKYLVNVDVLTTGFDAPNVDCVVMLRPTASRGLYVQQVGRGFRLHDSKDDCLVLDFAGNIRKHGPVNAPYDDLRKQRVWTKDSSPSDRLAQTAEAWECPQCRILNHGFGVCDKCHYVREDAVKHDVAASTEAVLAEYGYQVKKKPEWLTVKQVRYSRHVPKDESKLPTLRVDYDTDSLASPTISEWICLEHEGYAHRKAMAWWDERCDLLTPNTIEEALDIAWMGGIAEPMEIQVDTNDKWPRVIGYKLRPMPELTEADLDDIPF